jgi:hypothetical protein
LHDLLCNFKSCVQFRRSASTHFHLLALRKQCIWYACQILTFEYVSYLSRSIRFCLDLSAEVRKDSASYRGSGICQVAVLSQCALSNRENLNLIGVRCGKGR